ncbi:MAG TPA: hypothetical protein VFQ35_00085, partial [Polyangiaceae bacterium]|nr:hypothetical protein [Polyangiaceae bacterium]
SAAEPGVEPRAAAGRDLGAPLARSFAPKSSAGASHQAAPTELAGSERRLTQKATSATFAGELAQIDAARERLRAGDASLALELVRTYQSSFPDGQLRPEALAIAVEAELRSGRSAEARATAARFFSAYPNHPLAARIRALLGED